MSDKKKSSSSANKKSPTPGISSTDSQVLSSRVQALEELVREHLDEKNQWNGILRNWVGKNIQIGLLTGESLTGCLLWIDRYTIGLKDLAIRIVHKAAITVITLLDDKSIVINTKTP